MNCINPFRVRACVAIFVPDAAKVCWRSDTPKIADVGGLAAAGCAEVGIDRLAAIVDQDLAFSRPNRSDYCGNPTVREGASLRSTDGTLPHGRVSADEPLAVRRRAEIV